MEKGCIQGRSAMRQKRQKLQRHVIRREATQRRHVNSHATGHTPKIKGARHAGVSPARAEMKDVKASHNLQCLNTPATARSFSHKRQERSLVVPRTMLEQLKFQAKHGGFAPPSPGSRCQTPGPDNVDLLSTSLRRLYSNPILQRDNSTTCVLWWQTGPRSSKK